MKKELLRFLRGGGQWVHKRIRGQRRRVLLDGGSFMHFDQYRTLVPAMLEDPRLEVCITSSWGEDMTEAQLFEAARRLGLHERSVVPYARAKWQRWDVYLETCFDNPWLMWPCPRVDIFHGVAEKYVPEEDRLYMVHPLARTCDILCCPNTRLKQGFDAHADFLKPEAVVDVTGLSRQDCLVWSAGDGRLRDAVLGTLGLAPDKPTMLFAPTYGEGGLLHEWGEQILEYLAGMESYNVIVKLHPCSLMLTNDRFAAGIDWEGRVAAHTAGASHMRHLLDWDIMELLCIADVLIGDFGSTAIDFAVTGKPVLFYRSRAQRDALCGHDTQWTMLMNCCYDFDSMDGFIAHFEEISAVAVEGAGAGERQHAIDVLRDAYHPHMGEATLRTLRRVYRRMGLVEPQGITENAKPALAHVFASLREGESR